MKAYRKAFRSFFVFGLGLIGFCSAGFTQQPAASVSRAPVDLQANRISITPTTGTWLWHGGDDPRWADPSLDDSSWKTLQPARPWHAQGFSDIDHMAWFRFRIQFPADTSSLEMIMPRVGMSYQIFADGHLAGQAGTLPPQSPQVPVVTARAFTLPAEDAKPLPGAGSKEMLIAIRVWLDLRLAGISPDMLLGQAYVGSPRAINSFFSLLKASRLLSSGSFYTEAIISLIVGAASLVLFLLTRRDFYGWITLAILAGMINLPVQLASAHFGWGFFNAVYIYAASDYFYTLLLVIFILAAINIHGWKLVTFLTVMFALAEMGPILFILGVISQTAGDGLYFFASTIPEAIVAVLLVRAWKSGAMFVKLLLFSYALSFLIAALGNFGHFLLDLNVPHADALLTANIPVLSEPFSITLNDLGGIVESLGLLAALVYEFAESSREAQRLKSALQAASAIQHSLVPIDIPQRGGLRTEIVYLAAEEVGGDFCQVLPRPDGSTLIVIGDVSGKGLDAAMVGSVAVGALRSIADQDGGPATTLQRLNRVLLQSPNRGFVTCLCLVMTPQGRVTLSNAGHLPPYLNGQELPVMSGLPLGLVPDPEFEETEIDLPATARITLISDGVVEARSETGELYGFERTLRISGQPANKIAAEANRFGQIDDITVITLDWEPQAKPAHTPLFSA